MKPLTRKEFQDAIQKGLGRVILHLKEHGAGSLRDEILNACVHHLAYDAQVEGTRTDWLISIIDLTGEEEFYRQEILKALTESKEFWDVDQLVELTKVFAKRGNSEAKDTIRDKFDRGEFIEKWLFSDELLAIDGIDGFIRIAKRIGQEADDNRDDFETSEIYEKACELFGKETVDMELSLHANTDENLRKFLEDIDRIQKEEAQRKKDRANGERPRHSSLYFEQILNRIENCEGTIPWQYSFFGQKFATTDELEQLFARLLAETRRDQLLRYLWVFRRKELPRLDKKIFEIAASNNDEELQDAAINALANSKEPSIRELAIRLIREDKNVLCRGAIRLFEKNYQPGDYRIIEPALFVSENQDIHHCITLEIGCLCEINLLPELSNCLLWVYEHTPCTNCRDKAVECLIKMNCLPDAIREECRWDCSDKTRNMVKDEI